MPGSTGYRIFAPGAAEGLFEITRVRSAFTAPASDSGCYSPVFGLLPQINNDIRIQVRADRKRRHTLACEGAVALYAFEAPRAA